MFSKLESIGRKITRNLHLGNAWSFIVRFGRIALMLLCVVCILYLVLNLETSIQIRGIEKDTYSILKACGMLMAIGVMLNAVVLISNRGRMPIKLTMGQKYKDSNKYQGFKNKNEVKLYILCDIINFPGGKGSIGDILIIVAFSVSFLWMFIFF